MLTDWGRIAKQFESLEDLLKYVAYYLLDYDSESKEVPLTVEADSLKIMGKAYYNKNQKKVKTIDEAEMVVVVEAKAFYIEEDEARLEDYEQMKELVKIL